MELQLYLVLGVWKIVLYLYLLCVPLFNLYFPLFGFIIKFVPDYQCSVVCS
jgi:hypothetical protein